MPLTVPLLGGCDSCQRDRPFTPYRVDALKSATPQASAGPPASASSQAFVGAGAERPPSTERVVTLGARRLELPRGMRPELVLRAELTGDGQLDALVWVVPEDPAQLERRAALWLYSPGSDAKRLLEAPDFLPRGPGCILESQLEQLGPSTVSLALASRCDRAAQARTPTQALALLLPNAEPALRLGWRIAEPAPGERFSLKLSASDRDGDGREDPLLTLSGERIEGELKSSLEQAWLDRPAGASAEVAHFSQSLDATLKRLESQARKRSEAAQARDGAEALRRLLATVCVEAGTPRIWNWAGLPVPCGSLRDASTRLTRVEVEAALQRNDPLEAVAAASRGLHQLGELPAVELGALERLLSRSFVTVNSELSPPMGLRVTQASGPRWSPLWFEAGGEFLQIQLAGGTVERRDLAGQAAPLENDASAPSWPTELRGPRGERILSLVPACDRSEVLLALASETGQLSQTVPTRLLAPRPGLCTGRPLPSLLVQPIYWTTELPVLLVEGACLDAREPGACLNPPRLGNLPKGSPRSTDGRRLVTPTQLGVVVLGGAKPELWRGGSLESPGLLTDCVVADGARALACTRRGEVLLAKRK